MTRPHPSRRSTLPLIALSTAIMALGGIGFLALHAPKAQALPSSTIVLEGKRYQVELARTEREQAIGLMFRTHLDADKGMLFVFSSESPQAFWMKNTKIPLDILFFDREFRMVSMQEQVPPCQADPCPVYPSMGPAQYVLELAAGQAKIVGAHSGSVLTPPSSH